MAQPEAVLHGVGVPRERRLLGQRFALEDAARHDEKHLIDGININRLVRMLAEEDDAIADATDESSATIYTDRASEADPMIGLECQCRPFERRQRMQYDVLVNEDQMIVSCASRGRVERRARRWKRSVAIVDEYAVEIVDFGAMALNRAFEALPHHPSVVEHTDDRDRTALGPHLRLSL